MQECPECQNCTAHVAPQQRIVLIVCAHEYAYARVRAQAYTFVRRQDIHAYIHTCLHTCSTCLFVCLFVNANTFACMHVCIG